MECGQRPADLHRTSSFVTADGAVLVHYPLVKTAPDRLIEKADCRDVVARSFRYHAYDSNTRCH